MRRRLLAAFLGVTVLTILLFGVPRAFIVAERAREAEAQDLDRIANTVAGLAASAIARGEDPSAEDIAPLLGPGDMAAVTVLRLDAPLVVGGENVTDQDLQVTVDRPGGLKVTLGRSDAAVRTRVIASLQSLALIGLAVTAVSTVVAVVLARRLSQPFVALARDAERLGHGHFEMGPTDTRLPEAVAVRAALEQSARRLGETLRREREFASNASHQLRTPLAGLRLRLEDVTLWPDTSDEIRDELLATIEQVDRLSSTVSGLLKMSRAGTYGQASSVRARLLLETAEQRWSAATADAGRDLVIGRTDQAPVLAPVGAVDEVLDVLVHNALRHGTGTVTLEALTEGAHVRLRVRDEGDGIPSDQQSRLFARHERGTDSTGTGIGLALAQELAASAGGRLTVSADRPTRFDLVVPRAD